MNRLINTRCYLAGAMEKTDDIGVGWRNQVKRDLADLYIQWLDPCNKPIDIGKETPETHLALHQGRERGDRFAVQCVMSGIRAIDLRMVDVSDFVICYLDSKVATFGTQEEVARAASQHKPVLCVFAGGVKEAPLWWFDMLDHELFFNDWNELKYYLGFVSIHGISKEQKMKSQWILFDWTGE